MVSPADLAATSPESLAQNAARRTTWVVLWALFVVCAILPVGTAIVFASMFLQGHPVAFPYPDFFAFWTYGAFALGHPPAELFDAPALRAFQDSVGPALGPYPFLYPPPILLALLPLGALPYEAARVLFTALGLAVYVAALKPWRWREPLILLLLVAPSTFANLLIGQNGLFSGALMLGGLRLLWSRPALAGALLGLLSYKPQLFVLVPVLLLGGKHLRAMAACAATLALMFFASVAVFGWDIFPAWWASMAETGVSLASGRGHLDPKMPTVTAAVLQWVSGSAPVAQIARVAQIAGALLGAWCVWRTSSRRAPEALAVLPMATFLATPHAFYYDLALPAGAALALMAARTDARGAIPGGLLAAGAALILATIPVVQLGHGAALALLGMLPLLAVAIRGAARGEVSFSS